MIHNFFWHERVTWRDRVAAFDGVPRPQRLDALQRFLRFNGATGLTSILGNTLLMAIYVGVFGLPALLANAVAVGTMSAFNYVVSDRWVFSGSRAGRQVRPGASEKTTAVALLACSPLCTSNCGACRGRAAGNNT